MPITAEDISFEDEWEYNKFEPSNEPILKTKESITRTLPPTASRQVSIKEKANNFSF